MMAAPAALPLPGRLSQLRIVSGASPARRRASRPVAIASSVGFCSCERVAALGDSQRKDRKFGIRQQPSELFDVANREDVVDDAANDPDSRSVTVALDQRVEVVLAAEALAMRRSGLEQTDAADGPVAAARGELVGVEGHVRAMKATDAEMKDARGEGRAVVTGYRDAFRADGVQVRLRDFDRHQALPPETSRLTPVTYEASSESRKATTAATSLGAP